MRQRYTWSLVLVIAVLIGGIPTAQASSISVSNVRVQQVGSNSYQWSFNWSLIGFLVPGGITVAAPGYLGGALGSSGTFIFDDHSQSGGTVTGYGVGNRLIVTTSFGMPEPSLSFYLTLGLGLLGLVVSRNRFTKRPRSALPSA